MSCSPMQGLTNAQNFVHSVIESGSSLKLSRAGTKDAGGMVISANELTVKTYPIEHAPFTRNVKEIAGWVDGTDIIWTIEAKNRTIAQIRQYQDAEFDKRDYKISFVEYDSPFASTFLHIIIGGKL